MQTLAPKPWFKFYPSDVSPTLEFPKIPVYSLLSNTAAKSPSKVALSFEGRNITFKKLDELSTQFAQGLISLGLKKGERVALILPNLPQFIIAFYGALKAGAIVVPCNPLYRERELEFQLKDSGASAVVILNNLYEGNDFFQEFEKCRPRLREMSHVFVTSIADFLPPLKKRLAGPVGKISTVRREGTINFLEFLQTQRSDKVSSPPLDPEADLAVIQYTGGTTGTSKGAMLTHFNLVCNAIASAVWTGQDMGENTSLLAVIPFFHIYGLTIAMNAPIYAGQRIVILPRFKPDQVLKTIEKEKINIFPGVSTMYVALLNHPEIKNYSIQSVKRCVSGAAPLPQEIQKKFNQVTGGNLVEGYGLTEASPVTHCTPTRPGSVTRAGSIGVPFPNTDARIVDLETGTKELAVGEIGELSVRGPQVMKGYWNNPAETANVFRGDWLLTGDIAKMDEDGFFYIVDRRKDMIDASGFKVWPRDVEEVLFTHPNVKEAAVVGVMDKYRGETVKAFIVLKDKSKNTEAAEIQSFCRERMAPYKVPKIIEFRDDLPKSLIGKVLRRKLKEQSQ